MRSKRYVVKFRLKRGLGCETHDGARRGRVWLRGFLHVRNTSKVKARVDAAILLQTLFTGRGAEIYSVEIK